MAYSLIKTYDFAIKDSNSVEIVKSKIVEAVLSIDELTTHVISIAAGQTDVPVDLGGITSAKFLLVETDNEVSVTLVSSGGTPADAIVGVAKFLVLEGGSFINLFVSNNGTNAAVVKFVIGG